MIFTRNATEGLNLVAYAWGLLNLGPGDLVVVTELEHHSNFVPWQYIAGRTGAELPDDPARRAAASSRLDVAGRVSPPAHVKVVATNLVSNSLGTINPVAKLAEWAHARRDQVCRRRPAVPHRKVDVQALGCDFLAFSGHKMCGPSGTARSGARELLRARWSRS